MRLIDADKLYPDSVSIKGDRLCISQSQIANAPTVCDIEQIRAEIEENINYNKKMNYQGILAGLLLTLDIIDKHISGDMRGNTDADSN